MSTYTDVFGNDTVPPSGLGYASFTITTNTTFVWPYNTDGNPYPVAKVMDVACAAGNAITLPDAREVSTGEDFLIRNVGSNALIVKDAVGVQIASVAVGAASYFYLTDNTTVAGVYGVIGFGIGTSTVDAASLVGYGIKAVGASLNQSHPSFPTNTPITIDADHRAKLVVFTGGAGTFNLTSAATLGDDYFTLFRNEGTGTATLDPASGELIDGLSTLQIQPNESLMLICTGTQWYTVGYGRSVLYQFTQLTKDVSAGGTITLSAAEAANKLLTFIGNPSGAVNVVVPSIVAVYYTHSLISTTQTITLKTAAGSGVGINQNQRIIALCDGTNVVSAQSATVNASVSLEDGGSSVPSLFFATQTNTGMYKSGTQDLGVTVNGSTVGVFGSTGLQNSTIGANSTQRHTVPAVSSDTVALLAATQTLTNKTLSTGSTWQGNAIAVTYGGTGLTGIAALSVPVANALNTYTYVTATAGQSIRINAGGTAWEAFTPSASSGTVTSVSVTSANGFAGTVANATTTPAITLSTSVTGVLKGNGTSISAATAGTDYQAPLVSGTNIKTVNGSSLLGSGNLAVGDVTTTGTQELTNKTITDPKLTLGGTNGTAGQVPVSQGAGLPPVWGSVSTAEVKTPTNVSPATGSTNIGATPALTGSTYYSLYGVPMAAAQWQVSTVNDFATTVVNTGDVAGTSVAYTVGSGVLSTSTTYYWRVRYKDSNGVYSDWSTATTFTTAASFGPITIGEAYGGGYYAGKIVQGGTTYYLIVAPKSSGENSSKPWKTSNDAGPTATQTLNNGPAASAAMNSATYPAAQFCEGLSIGGYTDWYLPARDELELCYRNLKPTTTANNTSARSKSSYTYPEGNDVSGDTMGVNRNSSPTGAAYTSGSPAQTSVTLFQTGNTEAFAAAFYWSSSEYDSTYAWFQFFYDGAQNLNYKDGTVYVRAVRRLPV